MSKHIPILFSTPMVQAILEGRKTQTRRILKVKGCKPFTPDNSWSIEDIMRWNKDYHPYGQPGDVLWVRESFFAYGYWFRENENSRFEFRDLTLDPVLGVGSYQYMDSIPSIVHIGKNPGAIGWHKRPSIFMPKAACRIFLKVISVRVEILHDISEQDSMAEGIQQFTKDGQLFKYGIDGWDWSLMAKTAKDAVSTLWAIINGQESWDSNPWVWVDEFERCDKPENFGV